LAVEVEGGMWTRGRHVRGEGYEGDCEKYNAAVLGGWRVLRFTTGMLEQDPSGCIEAVRRVYDEGDRDV
jgi:very-short-patch-repair endonuclease